MARKQPLEISPDIARHRIRGYDPSREYPAFSQRVIFEAIWALRTAEDKQSRHALIRLLNKILDENVPPPSRPVFERICEIVAAREWAGALPGLKAFAAKKQRLRILHRTKQGQSISGFSSWRGPEVVTACKTITAIEGPIPDDKSHPCARQIQSIITDIERALGELDSFAETFPSLPQSNQDKQRKKYWESVDRLESELTEMLDDEKLAPTAPDELRHGFRVIERFDFGKQVYGNEQLGSEFVEALSTLAAGKGVRRKLRRDLVCLVDRAAKSDYVGHFQDALIPMYRLIAERNIKGCLPGLKRLSLSIPDEERSSLGSEALLKIACCRTILELEGISPKNRKDPTVRIAARSIRKFEKYVEWRREVWMLCDVGDGKPEELDYYTAVEKQLGTMKALLYEGFGALDNVTIHPWGM